MTVPFAVGQLLLSPRSAALVRRYGPKVVGTAGMFVMAAALAGYVLLGTASPVWLLGLLFFIQGAAIGAAMPAATSAVMDVLPRERAGAGSALTNTARQVGVALGVAVLGSILAQSYHQTLSPTLASLPAATRGAAGGSISATQAVAAQLGTAGRALLGPANEAFVSAMHVTTIVAAAIALAGAIVVLRWMPGLGSTAPTAEPVLAEPVTAEPLAAEPAGAYPVAVGRAALRPAAREAAEAPRIDPMDALDVWQEHLADRAVPNADGAVPNADGAAPKAVYDPSDEYLVDVWPGDFADRSSGVEG